MQAAPPEGRKVKSGPTDAVAATDRHERAKDYLSPAEMAQLLAAAKTGRHGLCDRFLDVIAVRRRSAPRPYTPGPDPGG